MRSRGTTTLTVVLVLGVAASSLAAAPGPPPLDIPPGISASKPRLMVGPLYPLTVRGLRFRSRESVTVMLDGGKRGMKKARANRSGTFRVQFDVRIARCGTVNIRAVGARGSRATYQMPRPDCREP
jgi:hypothetical protein